LRFAALPSGSSCPVLPAAHGRDAPSSKGKVRAESLREGWFAARFEEARTCFD